MREMILLDLYAGTSTLMYAMAADSLGPHLLTPAEIIILSGGFS